MFPTSESRLRTALRRSLDTAIEFATLGEYGWSPALDATGSGMEENAEGGAISVAGARQAPRCSGQPLRGRAFEHRLPRGSRSRDGMAPRAQACLAAAD